MLTKCLFSVVATALIAIAPALFAAPLEPKDVAASPAILAQLDCDALRSSSIGKSLLADPEVQNKLTTLALLFDFDLRSQLHGLTVYTTEEHPKDGVLIVYADFDPNRLTTLAKVADGSECLTNGSHVIYSWLDDKKKSKHGESKRIYGAILGHRVVFGQDDSVVASALDVIDGKAPSFSGKDGVPHPESGESIIAQAVAIKFPFDGNDQNSAIFKMSKSVRLKLSEAGDNLTAKVHFEASDSDTATQISAIAQGLVAVLKLQKTEADILKLANAVSIKQDGAAVTLSLSLPSSEIFDAVKERHEEAMKKKADATNAPPEKQ